METQILGIDEIETVNTGVNDLDTENINLIFIGVDTSSSMDTFRSDMRQSLADFKTAILESKEVDEILIARADFNHDISVGGYKKVSEFDTGYDSIGSTALFDVIAEGTKKLTDYMGYLKQQGMRVKAVFAIFSDGDDTASKYNNLHDAVKAVEGLNSQEIATAFISFGSGAERVAKDLKFKNILKVGNSASELRRAFNVLSKSVVEASKSATSKTDDFFSL